MKPISPLLGALLAASMTLTGCSNKAADPEPTAAASSATTSTPRASEPSRPASSAAVTAAVKVFELWSRNDVTYQAWWADLEPLLAVEAKQAYGGTDPRNIPAIRITGEPSLGALEPDSRGEIRTVTLPTSVGKFGVQMILPMGDEAIGDRWLMLRLFFPDGLH